MVFSDLEILINSCQRKHLFSLLSFLVEVYWGPHRQMSHNTLYTKKMDALQRSANIVYVSSDNNLFRFMSGKEIKKKKHLFGLRIRVPPIPSNGAMKTEESTEEVSHEFKIKGRKSSKSAPLPAAAKR